MGDIRNIKKGLDRLKYLAESFGYYFMPDFISRLHYNRSLRYFSEKDQEEILERAKYYVKLPPESRVGEEAILNGEFKFPFKEKQRHSAYFFDIYPFLRQQSNDFRFYYCNEDIDTETPVATFVKSRPVTNGYTNSVLCRLNSIRHFRFIKDQRPFSSKDDVVVMRNVVIHAPRVKLMEKWFGTPGTDFGKINADHGHPEWIRPRLTIEDQLSHKFIMCIRGNDVATNLKWVMSSNSVAVMPAPDVESWFMEGLLKPDYHYIKVSYDYSDLMDKLEWYKTHPRDAEEIVHNAHKWVDRFRERRMEFAVMDEVMRQYFIQTDQLKA